MGHTSPPDRSKTIQIRMGADLDRRAGTDDTERSRTVLGWRSLYRAPDTRGEQNPVHIHRKLQIPTNAHYSSAYANEVETQIQNVVETR